MKRLCTLALAAILASCGGGGGKEGGDLHEEDAPQFFPDEVVIRSRALIPVDTGTRRYFRSASSQNVPIAVVNAPSTSMSVDSSAFSIPTIGNSVLSFGSLSISELMDNDVKVCGNNGNQKCGTALLRVYTTGVAGRRRFESMSGSSRRLTRTSKRR